MKRRNFIRTTCIYAAGSLTAAQLLQGCTTAYYVNGVINDKTLTIRKTDFVIEKEDKTSYRPFVLCKPESLPFPICIYRFSEEKYLALYMECTHLGCELNAYEAQLVCPCHGSEFDNKGNVLQGPAERNLNQFNLTTDAENIYIDLNV